MCIEKLCEFMENLNRKAEGNHEPSPKGKVQRLFRKEVDYKCNRSAKHPDLKDDDIVYSNKKLLAA